jgi:hypothetical protein
MGFPILTNDLVKNFTSTNEIVKIYEKITCMDYIAIFIFFTMPSIQMEEPTYEIFFVMPSIRMEEPILWDN